MHVDWQMGAGRRWLPWMRIAELGLHGRLLSEKGNTLIDQPSLGGRAVAEVSTPGLVRWGRNWCLAWGLPVTTRHIGGALGLDWAAGAIQPRRDEEIGKMRKNRRKRKQF